MPTAPSARPRYGLALLLLLLTVFTTTSLGPSLYLWTRTDIVTDANLFLTPGQILRVWTEPRQLRLGLSISLPALFILLCHELGHYLACRFYRLPATLPYFLPAPLGLGTFGAFIRIRAAVRSKRQLFDVGIAGPLAGFVALLPFLLYGVAHSRPAAVLTATGEDATTLLLLPGHSLAVVLASRFFHGPLPPGTVLDLHPFAFAAWFGLLATSLNLLPLGQLDGGHILYAVTGRLQRHLALPLWLGLAALGLLWPGWWVWCLIVLVMGLPHPPVWDEVQPLGPPRRALAWVALAMLLLSFMPVPLDQIPLQ